MAVMTTGAKPAPSPVREHATGAALRGLVIALISFLTLVDLFAAQAILPSLVAAYGVSPATMGVAVNASTMGMAAAGILVALVSRRIDRRRGICASLALLAIPTSLLAVTPDVGTFTMLRIAQGVFMASAFTLTMAYLAEQCSAREAAGALAAYVTGNVAANLFGRMISAALADHLGLAINFYAFAALNLAGAVLVFVALERAPAMASGDATVRSALASWREHLRNAALRRCFGIGFLILFAFIGTFTYVNFVLTRAPIGLSTMALGLVYLVFLPSIVTTPLAGRIVARHGARLTFLGALAVAGAGLALLLVPRLAPSLTGLALVGVGTFLAQATATGFVSRAATTDRGAASGLYLASYYLGGLFGSALLGLLFDRLGWTACVGGIALALGLAALLARRLAIVDAGGGTARGSA